VHLAVEAQDGDAQPDAGPLRHPEAQGKHAPALDGEGPVRADDIGDHGGALVGEEVDEAPAEGLREAGERGPLQAVHHQRHGGVLQAVHAGLHREDASGQGLAARRQGQGHGGEMVLAARMRAGRPHIHGHGDQEPGRDGAAAADQVPRQRPGHGGHQHIVDGGAGAALGPLDQVQVQRRGPGHLLGAGQGRAMHGAAVRPPGEEAQQDAGRQEGERHRLQPAPRGRGARRGAGRGARRTRAVHQFGQQQEQGLAIADAVVEAHQERAGVFVVGLLQLDLPARMGRVEAAAGLPAQVRLEALGA